MAALDANENEYYLTDTLTAAQAVYDSYIRGYQGPGGRLCKYAYTDKEQIIILN